MLRDLDAASQLGLPPQRLYTALREFCEDLLATSDACWSRACRIDEQSMAAMLREVQDRALRERLMKLCIAVVEADGRIDDGESIVLTTAVEQWGLDSTSLLEPAAEGRRATAAALA